eukprot:jgi/Mesvir1/26201/Mv02385-RA.1
MAEPAKQEEQEQREDVEEQHAEWDGTDEKELEVMPLQKSNSVGRSDLTRVPSKRDIVLHVDSPRSKTQTCHKASHTWIGVVAVTTLMTLSALAAFWSYSAHLPIQTCSHACQVCGLNGVVSSSHYLASEAGLRILKRGGNAVDAAAAVQFVLNVVQPQSAGIGGGSMILMSLPRKRNGASTSDMLPPEVIAIDGREEAPASLTPTTFCKDPPACTAAQPFSPDRVTGGLPVGVPGTLSATVKALAEHGTMTLQEVLEPAIRAARLGFPMYDHLHAKISQNKDRLALYPASAALFLNNNKTAPRVAVGETFVNEDLAQTLELIGLQGEVAFYRGPVGKDLVAAVNAAWNPWTGSSGGKMTEADLASYAAVTRVPVCSTYRAPTINTTSPSASSGSPSLPANGNASSSPSSAAPPPTGGHARRLLTHLSGEMDYGRNGWEVCGFPPPSSGGLSLLQMLNLLEGFDEFRKPETLDPLMAGLPGTPGGPKLPYQPLPYAERRRAALWRMVDAQNVAFADRAKYIADADFSDVPLDGILSKQYAAERRAALMSPPYAKPPLSGGAEPIGAEGVGRAVVVPVAPGVPPATTSRARQLVSAAPSKVEGTAHFSVIDGERNVVAWTSTIEMNMGSAVVVPGRGFLLNNELTDFEPLPRDPVSGAAYANQPEGTAKLRKTAGTPAERATTGRKRPRSSMSPTIVRDLGEKEHAFLAIGGVGGSKIIGSVLNVLINLLDLRLPLEEALDAPRAIARNEAELLVEPGILEDRDTVTYLRSLGLELSSTDDGSAISNVNVAVIGRGPLGLGEDDKDHLCGVSDSARMPTAHTMAY